MWYTNDNERILEFADHKFKDEAKYTQLCTMDEYINEPYKLIIVDGEAVLNPDYEQEKERRERERISHLRCTKRVFVLILEQMGLDYFEQIEPLINSNRQAKLEWELCVELERNNPLLDVIGEELGVSSEQLDNVFKYANGEIPTLEVE